ncbi:MAG TPA: hypothetical protein VH300_18985 [Thermoleophilaceae bacterium]|jgi:hypothetical protein|nr:hypothetical protein [Thermoleophilaceae bacterium]
MPRLVLVSLTVVVALSFLPASQARDQAKAVPRTAPCTPSRPCIHVFRVRSSTSGNSHVAWDSRPRFAQPNLGVSVRYTPQLPSDQDVRTAPISDCGVHFWLNGRFNGVATRCGDGPLPLHVQIANVHNKPLRVVLTYWAARPRPLNVASIGIR